MDTLEIMEVAAKAERMRMIGMLERRRATLLAEKAALGKKYDAACREIEEAGGPDMKPEWAEEAREAVEKRSKR